MRLRPRHSAASAYNDGASMTEWFHIEPVRRAGWQQPPIADGNNH
jgi:hypothetical protein